MKEVVREGMERIVEERGIEETIQDLTSHSYAGRHV